MVSEKGLNYWWGNDVKYGRTQWSFFTSEKPYETISWNIKNVGSLSVNDCLPASFSEAEAYFDENISYEQYKTITKYQDNMGVFMTDRQYENLLSEYFDMSKLTASVFDNPQAVRNILNDGGLIHTSMPDGGIFHSDNLRSISYYSNKIVLRYRIGSYKLSSVNNDWLFYILKKLR